MPLFKPTKKDYVDTTANGEPALILSKKSYDSFGPSLLGLGDIKTPSKAIDAIAAMFDLEGFTNFSKQIEPHLSVPLFLSSFLEWLFTSIKSEMSEETHPTGVRLYSQLPFFVKFMGDGLLIVWDISEDADPVQLQNMIMIAHATCKKYRGEFLPTMKNKIVSAPPRLRCGIARGTIYSVGDGNDFVGSCINMAARLQKIPGLTFAFNRRGFDLESEEISSFFTKDIVIKRMSVRGIGDEELIGILVKEFDSLKEDDQLIFQDP